LFAKTTFIIFVAVMFSIITALISFSTVKSQHIPLPPDNPLSNITNLTFAYTGFNFTTFVTNLRGNYTIDYSQPDNPNSLNFETVFAILFNGCTGIMAGANISGDLKNPSVAIPQGTLLACGITFCIYIILFTFSAFTCEPGLLINNYNYLQAINLEPAFITIGVFCATLSAALATLIGGSRILYALAKDRLFSTLYLTAGSNCTTKIL
jgi:potassium/chloride transporter 9